MIITYLHNVHLLQKKRKRETEREGGGKARMREKRISPKLNCYTDRV